MLMHPPTKVDLEIGMTAVESKKIRVESRARSFLYRNASDSHGVDITDIGNSASMSLLIPTKKVTVLLDTGRKLSSRCCPVAHKCPSVESYAAATLAAKIIICEKTSAVAPQREIR